MVVNEKWEPTIPHRVLSRPWFWPWAFSIFCCRKSPVASKAPHVRVFVTYKKIIQNWNDHYSRIIYSLNLPQFWLNKIVLRRKHNYQQMFSKAYFQDVFCASHKPMSPRHFWRFGKNEILSEVFRFFSSFFHG